MTNSKTKSGAGSPGKKPAGKVENTSKNHEFFGRYFKKNPKADQNEDGVLTATEYKKYKVDQEGK